MFISPVYTLLLQTCILHPQKLQFLIMNHLILPHVNDLLMAQLRIILLELEVIFLYSISYMMFFKRLLTDLASLDKYFRLKVNDFRLDSNDLRLDNNYFSLGND